MTFSNDPPLLFGGPYETRIYQALVVVRSRGFSSGQAADSWTRRRGL
jgi:hypothetical protein